MIKKSTIYTIGYANLTLDRFCSYLAFHGVDAVCDVRSSPFSRSNSDFNKDALKSHLNSISIEYVFLGKELGARSPDPAVYANGRVEYDRLASTVEFQNGLARVETGADRFTIALMCAERDPVTCHRTILVARHLIERGFEVEHILDTGRAETHQEAMRRLVRMYGLEHKAVGNEALIERQIYKLQGRKIAYFDPRFQPSMDENHQLPGVP